MKIEASQTLLAQSLISPWWTQRLQGIAAIILGLYVLARPGVALATIAFFYGLFLLMEGLGQGYRFLTNRTGQVKRGYVLFMAIVYSLAGIAVIINPLMSTIISGLVISATIGIFAIISGVIELSSGISPVKGEKVQLGYVFAGILNVAVGLIFLSNPIESSFALAMWMGILITVVGATCIFNSFKFKKIQANMVETFA